MEKPIKIISSKLQHKLIKKQRVKEFYYTPIEVVILCLKELDINKDETVLDAGSGKNKVWFNSVNVNEKYECEIEDGCNFYEWEREVDWVIGNPPFQEGWKFLEKASRIARKGIAFLGNINFWNCLTPRRLSILAQRGFWINKILILEISKWFGRYYFIIWTRNKTNWLKWVERKK